MLTRGRNARERYWFEVLDVWVHYAPERLACDVPASEPTSVLPPADFHRTDLWYDTVIGGELILNRHSWGGHEIGPDRLEGWRLAAPTAADRWVAVSVLAPCGAAAVYWARQPDGTASEEGMRDFGFARVSGDLAWSAYERAALIWLPPAIEVPGAWWIFVATPDGHPGPIHVAWLDPPESTVLSAHIDAVPNPNSEGTFRLVQPGQLEPVSPIHPTRAQGVLPGY